MRYGKEVREVWERILGGMDVVELGLGMVEEMGCYWSLEIPLGIENWRCLGF